MLNLYFGDREDALYSGDGWFDHQLDKQYITTDFSKRVIKDIDNSEVYGENLVISPIFGGIPPRDISGGSKALITLMYTDKIFSLTAFGENCYPYILEIASTKDITLCNDSIVTLFEFGTLDKVHILNDDSFVYSDRELIDKYIENYEEWGI